MSLFDAMKIGEQGLDAQAQRIQVHVNNITNADTPTYKRKIPVLEAREDVAFSSVLQHAKDNVFKTGIIATIPGGINMPGYILDPSPGKKSYMPGHPDADKNGFVESSNVNILADMADAHMSSRAYEASLALIGVVKAMAQRAADIGRG